jgi:hypothetical protein
MTPTRRGGPPRERPAPHTFSHQHSDQPQSKRPGRQCGADGQPSLFDDAPADEDALAGRAQAERHCDDWWTSTALQAVRAMARSGREFQAFDLVEIYRVPEPDHPNRWGALLTRAAREGVIVSVGAAPSHRPSTARSLTRTWRGAP